MSGRRTQTVGRAVGRSALPLCLQVVQHSTTRFQSLGNFALLLYASVIPMIHSDMTSTLWILLFDKCDPKDSNATHLTIPLLQTDMTSSLTAPCCPDPALLFYYSIISSVRHRRAIHQPLQPCNMAGWRMTRHACR